MVKFNQAELIEAFLTTRNRSIHLCEPLERDDYCLQAEPFVSPPKWHLAHTTWFFETFILKCFVDDYQSIHPQYEVLFNSYYNGIGEQFPRPKRGLLSRPSLESVFKYRDAINDAMESLLSKRSHPHYDEIKQRCLLGIEHEKQHQELLLTDIKYSLFQNPLYPAYITQDQRSVVSASPMSWVEHSGGLVEVGVEAHTITSPNDFYFDNEAPRHSVFVQPFSMANRLVSNQEYQAFIDDGGYQRPEFWLADGWTTVQAENWKQPLYWLEHQGMPMEFTLHGLLPRDPAAPVCHISAYEADAYASWCGARLPTEFEWELAALNMETPVASPATSPAKFHPQAPADLSQSLAQAYGDCWQWTSSAYRPYPNFKAGEGAIGEYNGKFMCNQWVLRGGSCVSPSQHVRATYRNFFYPGDRWQFFGIRLAK